MLKIGMILGLHIHTHICGEREWQSVRERYKHSGRILFLAARHTGS